MQLSRWIWIALAIAALALTFVIIASSSRGEDDRAVREEVIEEVAASAPQVLARYIQIDTTNPPGGEAAAADFLAEQLAAAGIDSWIVESAPGRANLYARLAGGGDRGAVLLLHHMDVVPVDRDEWAHAPYAGDVVDGKIFGRGALDAKGVGVVQLLAMLAIKRAGIVLDRDIVFLATADEETGGRLGAGWFVREHFDRIADVEYVLNEGGFIHRDGGRPLVYNVNAAEKGPCWFRLVARGAPGHASRPPQETAVTRLVHALERLLAWERPLEVGPIVAGYYAAYAELDPKRADQFRDLARALEDPAFRAWFLADPEAAALVRDTLTPTVLRGSTKTNVIPATAVAEIDSRLLPGHDCAAFLEAVAERVGDPKVGVEPAAVAFPASASPIDNDFIAAVQRTAAEEEKPAIVLPGLLAGFTDSHWFREKGIDAYGFVPIEVSAEQRASMHGPNENVDVAAISAGVHRLVRLLRELSR